MLIDPNCSVPFDGATDRFAQGAQIDDRWDDPARPWNCQAPVLLHLRHNPAVERPIRLVLAVEGLVAHAARWGFPALSLCTFVPHSHAEPPACSARSYHR